MKINEKTQINDGNRNELTQISIFQLLLSSKVTQNTKSV